MATYDLFGHMLNLNNITFGINTKPVLGYHLPHTIGFESGGTGNRLPGSRSFLTL
jgi:hypothetical protein